MRTPNIRVIVFLAMSSTAVFARIGETEAQSVARYGKVLDSFPCEAHECKNLSFWKDGFAITADFLNDKCCSIHFEKAPTYQYSFTHPTPEAENSLTEVEAVALLNQNAPQKDWIKSDGHPAFEGDVTWNAKDGIWADLSHGVLSISTAEFATYMEKNASAKSAKESKKAEQETSGL